MTLKLERRQYGVVEASSQDQRDEQPSQRARSSCVDPKVA